MKLLINAYLDHTLFMEKGCNKDEPVVTDDVTQTYLNFYLMCLSQNHNTEIKSHAGVGSDYIADEAGKKLLH